MIRYGSLIMGCGSMPYVGMALGKKCTNDTLEMFVVKGLHEPYQALKLPSASMGNGTINFEGEYC